MKTYEQVSAMLSEIIDDVPPELLLQNLRDVPRRAFALSPEHLQNAHLAVGQLFRFRGADIPVINIV